MGNESINWWNVACLVWVALGLTALLAWAILTEYNNMNHERPECIHIDKFNERWKIEAVNIRTTHGLRLSIDKHGRVVNITPLTEDAKEDLTQWVLGEVRTEVLIKE
jgi:hypothetical protein